MAYPVNPDDATTPTNSQGAKQGAEELRALKAKANALAVANTSGASIRQAIQSASLDANGYNNAITVGVGLRPGLLATAIPYQLSYASGFLLGKVLNQEEAIIADVADILGADLAINNTSYIYRTFGVAFKSTLVPKQEGYVFDKSKQSLLNFEGINGAITTTDDFGSTWALTANTINTAQFKFGTASMLAVINGVASSTGFTTQGDGSWQEELWFRPTTVGVIQVLLTKYNAANFGIDLRITAANVLSLSLSSTGAANDIAAAVLGATALLINTWYKVRVTFDALAGTYRVYLSNNGANETQEINVASAARICSYVTTRIGNDNGLATGARGNIDAYRFLPCATKTAVEVPSVVAPTVNDFVVYFFQIATMKGFEVTAASVAGGVNPTLTAANDLFLAEADTSGVAVTAIRNRAVKDQFISVPSTPIIGGASSATVNHNIGSLNINVETYLINLTTQAGYIPGERVKIFDTTNGAFGVVSPITWNRRSASTSTEAGNWNVIPKAGGARINLTSANWALVFEAKRTY
jgi:hypothetical protein